MAAGAGQAFFGADGHSVLQPQVCDKLRLKDLLKEIDPNQALDDDVAELLVEMAHDFVDRVVTFSCQIARHRGSDTLEARDVQLHLERSWDMRVPGFGHDDFALPSGPKPTEAHRQRQSAIQKDIVTVAKKRKLESKKDDMAPA